MAIRRRVVILAVLALAAAVSPAVAADADIDKLAGVYKSQFKNGTIDGGKYQSENILEIVKVSQTSAYVRAHLEFFNGHVCNMWGVARPTPKESSAS